MAVALVWLVCGCGRLGFDLSHGSVDSNAGGAGSDGGGDAKACTVWDKFGAPTRIPEVGAVGADDWGPFVTADNLTMYLFSSRAGSMNGSFDIWTATRSDPGAVFSTPVLVSNVNSIATERSPWLSSDGLTLGFSSARAGGLGMHDIYTAQRFATTAAFGPPLAMPVVNTASDEFFSIESANGLRLYMTSTRLGSLDVFVSSRATLADAFGTPVAIAELNTLQTERHIAISADELEVFIDSDRTGAAGIDIYRATRPDLGSPFSTPVPVPELNSSGDEVAPQLSADGSTLYYGYNTVVNGGADAEIWFATRACLAH